MPTPWQWVISHLQCSTYKLTPQSLYIVWHMWWMSLRYDLSHNNFVVIAKTGHTCVTNILYIEICIPPYLSLCDVPGSVLSVAFFCGRGLWKWKKHKLPVIVISREVMFLHKLKVWKQYVFIAYCFWFNEYICSGGNMDWKRGYSMTTKSIPWTGIHGCEHNLELLCFSPTTTTGNYEGNVITTIGLLVFLFVCLFVYLYLVSFLFCFL